MNQYISRDKEWVLDLIRRWHSDALSFLKIAQGNKEMTKAFYMGFLFRHECAIAYEQCKKEAKDCLGRIKELREEYEIYDF